MSTDIIKNCIIDFLKLGSPNKIIHGKYILFNAKRNDTIMGEEIYSDIKFGSCNDVAMIVSIDFKHHFSLIEFSTKMAGADHVNNTYSVVVEPMTLARF